MQLYGPSLCDLEHLQNFEGVRTSVLAAKMLRLIRQMHENDFLHRDIKPENFLVKSYDSIDNFELVLIDFGLVGTLQECQENEELSFYGTVEILMNHAKMIRPTERLDVLWK